MTRCGDCWCRVKSQLTRIAVFGVCVFLAAPTRPSSAQITSRCTGDCNDDAQARVNELVLGVNILLGVALLDACPTFDADVDSRVEVNELVQGVSDSVKGCIVRIDGICQTSGREGLQPCDSEETVEACVCVDGMPCDTPDCIISNGPAGAGGSFSLTFDLSDTPVVFGSTPPRDRLVLLEVEVDPRNQTNYRAVVIISVGPVGAGGGAGAVTIIIDPSSEAAVRLLIANGGLTSFSSDQILMINAAVREANMNINFAGRSPEEAADLAEATAAADEEVRRLLGLSPTASPTAGGSPGATPSTTPTASASPTPSTTEFQVNRDTSVGVQYQPDVATISSGEFIVIWEGGQPEFGGDLDVFGQRFDSIGVKLESDFRVNEYTDVHQRAAAVAANANGIVAVWQSSSQDGGVDDIFAQRFSIGGQFLGSEFRVNTFTTSSQSDPDVVMMDDGFVVVWRGALSKVRGQRFDSAACYVGSEFEVSTQSDALPPRIAALSGSSFVVVWNGDDQGDQFGIFAQRYDASSAELGSELVELGSELHVNGYTPGRQNHPAVAASPNGSFTIVWQSQDQDGDGLGIFGRRYTSEGNALGTEFTVNTSTTNDQENPSLTYDGNDSFLVVWESGLSTEIDVRGQWFSNDGTTLGSEFQVNETTSGRQQMAEVAATLDGKAVVVWQSTQGPGGFNVIGRFVQRPTPTP
jgi:hypothetical protein